MQKVKIIRTRKLRLLFLALTLLLAGLIFYMSSEPATASGERSTTLAEAVVTLFHPQFTAMTAPQQEVILSQTDHFLRKGAHFCVYAALGALLLLDSLGFSAKPLRHGVRAWLCATLYAASDEIHQAFVPGRGPAVKDVLLDSTGALCGILTVWLLVWAMLRRRQK